MHSQRPRAGAQGAQGARDAGEREPGTQGARRTANAAQTHARFDAPLGRLEQAQQATGEGCRKANRTRNRKRRKSKILSVLRRSPSLHCQVAVGWLVDQVAAGLTSGPAAWWGAA